MNKNIFVWLFIILFGLFIFNIYYKPKKNYDNVIFSDFVEAVQAEKIPGGHDSGKKYHWRIQGW